MVTIMGSIPFATKRAAREYARLERARYTNPVKCDVVKGRHWSMKLFDWKEAYFVNVVI
jgi:hypothetical protein